MEKVFVILNPASKARSGKRMKRKLIPLLDQYYPNRYNLLETAQPEDAIRLSRMAADEGATLIIAVGGDGTIHEVINGLMQLKNTRKPIRLGIINNGSGGDFCRTLKLPNNLADQFELIKQTTPAKVDIGFLECLDPNGNSIRRYFINECQVGIGGAVVSKVNQGHKYLGGTIAFTMVALTHLFHYTSRNFKISTKDFNQSYPLLGIVAGNGKFCGGGMQLTPGASLDDGLLDILLIHKMNFLNRLVKFSKIFSGNPVPSRFLTRIKSSQITIEADRDVWIEADGELIGKPPCTISILPLAVEVHRK